MPQPIDFDLNKLIEVLTNLQQKHGNIRVQMYDYRLEQFTSIDGIEFETHDKVVQIT